MRIFVTGATGFVGSAVTAELLAHGHQVMGLARSDANAAALTAAGAIAHRGDLADPASLAAGAAACDGVIHTGFIHDFARMKEVSEIDRRAIEALGKALHGSNRPLVVTSGTALVNPGHLATELQIPTGTAHPRQSERAADAVAATGVHVSVVRLSPSVHGDGDHGFVPLLINLAREKSGAAYVGDGANRWSAVHRLDAARLYRLALEKGRPGARYHGVGEQAVAFLDIAAAIGRGLHLPVIAKSAEEAPAHFGWFTAFASLDCPASADLTRSELGWQPTHPGLIEDLATSSTYFSP